MILPPRCISVGDYVYFQEHIPRVLDEDEAPSSFLFYYFDTESNTMYYFEYVDGFEGITWGSLPLFAGYLMSVSISVIIWICVLPILLIFHSMIKDK